jgi:hypothetical protein
MHYSICLFIAILMVAISISLLFLILPLSLTPVPKDINFTQVGTVANPIRNAPRNPIPEPVIDNRPVINNPKKKKNMPMKKKKEKRKTSNPSRMYRKQWKMAGRTRR